MMMRHCLEEKISRTTCLGEKGEIFLQAKFPAIRYASLSTGDFLICMIYLGLFGLPQ